MPVTEQDARAIAYLASRLREDTYGACKWDAPGIWAEVSPLIGQNLAVSIERVTRHAQDPTAKTPGAIRRPYTPGPPQSTRELDNAPVGSRCTVCGEQEARCRRLWTPSGDKESDQKRGLHEFTRPIPRDVDLSPVIAELKGHIQPATTQEES